MLRKIFLVIVLCIFVIVVLNSYSNFVKFEGTNSGIFKPVHLINLNSAEDENQFLNMLKDLNTYLAELGIKDIKYQAWKARDDQEGKYKYIFESTWPDQATYDKAHDSEVFKKFLDKWQKYEKIFKDHEYCRYVPFN